MRVLGFRPEASGGFTEVDIFSGNSGILNFEFTAATQGSITGTLEIDSIAWGKEEVRNCIKPGFPIEFTLSNEKDRFMIAFISSVKKEKHGGVSVEIDGAGINGWLENIHAWPSFVDSKSPGLYTDEEAAFTFYANNPTTLLNDIFSSVFVPHDTSYTVPRLVFMHNLAGVDNLPDFDGWKSYRLSAQEPVTYASIINDIIEMMPAGTQWYVQPAFVSGGYYTDSYTRDAKNGEIVLGVRIVYPKQQATPNYLAELDAMQVYSADTERGNEKEYNHFVETGTTKLGQTLLLSGSIEGSERGVLTTHAGTTKTGVSRLYPYNNSLGEVTSTYGTFQECHAIPGDSITVKNVPSYFEDYEGVSSGVLTELRYDNGRIDYTLSRYGFSRRPNDVRTLVIEPQRRAENRASAMHRNYSTGSGKR